VSRPVFVSVLLEMGACGIRRPLAFTWEDGSRYEVARSRYLGYRAARSAGAGECWLCRVEGREVPLYYSPLTRRWWMDGRGEAAKAPAAEPYRRVKDRGNKGSGP